MTLNLTQQQFDYVVQVLAQRPYAEVAELMNSIGQQARTQVPTLPEKANGEIAQERS